MQTIAISRLELQLLGVAESQRLFKIYDAVIDDYIEWASNPTEDEVSLAKIKSLAFEGIFADHSDFAALWGKIHSGSNLSPNEKNGLYIDATDALQEEFKQIINQSELMVQDRAWKQKLVEAVYIMIPNDSAYVAQIYALSVIDNDVSDKLSLFRQHVDKSKKTLESSYQSLETEGEVDEIIFSNARQQLLDIYRWDGKFIDAIEANLSLKKGEGILEAKIAALRVVQNIREARYGAQAVIKDLLQLQLSKYTYERYLFTLSLIVFVVLMALILIFRVITGDFSWIKRYVDGLSRGDFSAPLYHHPKDLLGQLSIAVKEMGEMIRRLVGEIQTLSQYLVESTSTIAETAYEQARIVSVQQENQRNLEETSRGVAELSKKLADEMAAFASEAKERLMEDVTEEKIGKMLSEMSALKKSSANILETLSEAHLKVIQTNALAGLMTKVSERASLLHLNADIEAVQIGKERAIFRGVIDKIRNFSDTAASSSGEIKAIVGSMSESVLQGKETAEQCLGEITAGASRLVLAGIQINRIISQDQMQTGNFLKVNQMMGRQNVLAQEIIDSISSLGRSIQGNAAVLYRLYATVAELRTAANELEDVAMGLFDNHQEVKE